MPKIRSHKLKMRHYPNCSCHQIFRCRGLSPISYLTCVDSLNRIHRSRPEPPKTPGFGKGLDPSGPGPFYVMSEKQKIERRMDELAREYGRTPPGDPRRSEIFKEVRGCASVLTAYELVSLEKFLSAGFLRVCWI
jgi:hypothetical protein